MLNFTARWISWIRTGELSVMQSCTHRHLHFTLWYSTFSWQFTKQSYLIIPNQDLLHQSSSWSWPLMPYFSYLKKKIILRSIFWITRIIIRVAYSCWIQIFVNTFCTCTWYDKCLKKILFQIVECEDYHEWVRSRVGIGVTRH